MAISYMADEQFTPLIIGRLVYDLVGKVRQKVELVKIIAEPP